MSEHSVHYRQHMDARYMPQALHAVNHLACRTFQKSVTFFKWAKMMGIPKERHLGFCRIAIRTQNYCVSSHVDKSNKQTTADMVLMSRTWMGILSIKVLHSGEHERLDNVLHFMKTYGFGVHTTCSYQFTATRDNPENEPDDVHVFQVFVFPTLGISKRVRTFETHMWMAHVVQHATCVPVFVHNGEVSFVTNDHVSVEAWGADGK